MPGPCTDFSGKWKIQQSNGFTVDVSMNQQGEVLSAFCTHSNGHVRSRNATGTANGDGMTLVIEWDNGTKGEYTGHLHNGFFTRDNQGILKGTTKDLNNPGSTASFEVPDKVFYRP